MANFSLINVSDQQGEMVAGKWLQHHVAGTLESATERARATEEVNDNRLDVAVVEEISGANICSTWNTPMWKRLDTKRVRKINY